jgi:ZIP family zinc transporter
VTEVVGLPLLVAMAVLPFFSTTIGGLAALRAQHRIHPLMAFAAGMVIATALSDLLPEGIELMGPDVGRLLPATAMIAGYLAFSGVDAAVHARTWERVAADGGTRSRWAPARLIGFAQPAGVIAHSLLDGVAIGLGFSASTETGILVAAAVLAHDIADGINVVTLALAQGRGQGEARLVLLLDALAPALGIVIGTQIPVSEFTLGVLLAVFAGVFLAIGAGHLLPEAQHRQPGVALPLVLAAGCGAVFILVIQSQLG